MSHRILLVDDDLENLDVNKKLLSVAGYQVITAKDGPTAIQTVRNAKRDFSLILMDYHMPEMSGAATVQAIRAIKPHQQILGFSMDDTKEVMRETFRAGALDFLDKNSDNDILLESVRSYCAKYEDLYQSIELCPGKDEKATFLKDLGMVGCSDSLYQLGKQIKKIAPTQATTLILGESGTGKELVAKALHQQSTRAKFSFVAINVAAQSTSLIESELFGHKKGSFTGATSDQLGKFQLADKGTIFLDEIGDLSLDLQVKLLRVLQEKEIMPVGSPRTKSIDVRIIAATHRDLNKMVGEGTFREDLYYRLSNVVISTTPLRDRPDDIEPLVAFFTEEVCQENKFSKAFQKRCLEVFRAHGWSGNIRQLRSVVERHLIKSDVSLIQPDHLEQSLFIKYVPQTPITMDDIDAHTEEIKKSLVIEVMKSTKNKAEAARKLGIAQNRLSYFISKWNLDGEGIYD